MDRSQSPSNTSKAVYTQTYTQRLTICTVSGYMKFSGYMVVEFNLCPHMCVSKTWISVLRRVFQSSPSFQT